MNARRSPIARSTQGLKRTPIKRKASRRQSTVYGIKIRGEPCAYCGKAASTGDHVIPRSMVKSYNLNAPAEALSIPAEWLAVVACCLDCNLLKGVRRLVPMTWAKHVAKMNAFFSGAPFRTWNGDPKHPSYAEVWK